MEEFIIQNQFIILIFLGLITLTLSIYLGLLFTRLWQHKKNLKKNEQELKSFLDQKRVETKESIRIICLATIQDQCEVSEAVIRLQKLVEFIPEHFEHINREILKSAYEDFGQFDYLEERKALSKQQRFDQDKRRFDLEKLYENKIKDFCREILSTISA
jgi:hypothetical protein